MKLISPLPAIARGYAAAVVILCALVGGMGSVHGATAVFSGIDIVGSEKGLALTLTADAPFDMAVSQKAPGKNNSGAVVSIRCSQAIYGLDEFSFSDFPAGPVRRIAASESLAAGSFELLIDLTIVPDSKILSRQKGNKWIVLLSRSPMDPFSWSSAPPAAAAARPPVPDNGQSRLTDVTLLARDRVERITFQFDRATVMRLKREADRVVVLFVNATSDLSAQRLAPPSVQLARIELRQVAHGGTMWLGASLFPKTGSASGVLLQAFSDRLVIFCATDSTERLSVWSARNGPSLSYPFVKIPQFGVDYKSMEEKARLDATAPAIGGASTFAISDEQPVKPAVAPAQEPSPTPTSQPSTTTQLPASRAEARAQSVPESSPPAQPLRKKEPATVRVLVSRNSVNLRAGPTSSDSVLCRLPMGTAATPLAKQDAWMKIATEEATGWVAAAMVVDSADAPGELLEKMKQLQARLLEKKAAEEKAAVLKAQKERLLEEQKAQKQKLLEEQQAKKHAAREVQEKLALEQKAQKQAKLDAAAQAAASRDSALQDSTAQQDSLEKAKRYHGPKLVEYHVYGRDPFLPLSRDRDSPVPYVEDLDLVGILYDQVDRIGLFEDKQDKTRAYALRENDPVQNGSVLRVQPDKVLFLINELGISRTYALKLTKGKQDRP
jgi:hypothetical protein